MTEGTTQDDLLDLFGQYGSVADICMMPGKSYSFVAFSQADSAMKAYNHVHGLRGLGTCPDRVLYLTYIDGMPTAAASPEIASFMTKWRPAEEWPPGLRLVEDFVSPAEAEAVLSTLHFQTTSGLKNRQVKHYGFEFRYDVNNMGEEAEAFPREWLPILERALEAGHIDQMPDQCTVNRYEPGHGIPPHVDTHSCERIEWNGDP